MFGVFANTTIFGEPPKKNTIIAEEPLDEQIGERSKHPIFFEGILDKHAGTQTVWMFLYITCFFNVSTCQ